jgi:hypothetical protein
VKNRLAWVSGALGAVALLRSLTRRRPAPAAPVAPQEPAHDPRAEELRRRLDESRALADERDEFEDGETPVDAAEPVDPEERRREVHARGKAATDHMRRGSDAG